MVSLTIEMKSNEWFSIQLPPSVEVHAWCYGRHVLSVPLSSLTCLQLEVMIRRERGEGSSLAERRELYVLLAGNSTNVRRDVINRFQQNLIGLSINN